MSEMFDKMLKNLLSGDITSLSVNNFDLEAKSESGSTLLMFLADRGYKELVELLIKHGADVNAKNNKGNTALIYATNNRVVDSIKIY